MEVPLSRAVGVPGVEEGGDDAENVGWCGEQERFDVAVPEGLDDGGEEVRYRAGRDDAEEHQHLLCGVSREPLTFAWGRLTMIHILMS